MAARRETRAERCRGGAAGTLPGGLPKNDVLLPSGPETSGFCNVWIAGRRLPDGSNAWYDGPNELKSSLWSGLWFP